MQIQDGSGNSYWVKVDSYNRMHTYATNKPEIAEVSVNRERAFSVSSSLHTFNSTNEHPFLWIKNIDPSLVMFLSSVIYSFNGGNTTFNRSMTKRVYTCYDPPTGRYEEITPVNLSIGSLNTPLMTAYQWDGTGDGLDIDLTGKESLSTSIISKGSIIFSEIEVVNLKFNSCLIFTYEPEEIGNASISSKLYFNHK